MFYAVYCTDKANTKETRDKYLGLHREYLDQHMSKIFFSGPLQTDDASLNFGSLFILNVPSRAVAEDFVANEPFNQQGIFADVRISRMRKGRYNASLADVE